MAYLKQSNATIPDPIIQVQNNLPAGTSTTLQQTLPPLYANNSTSTNTTATPAPYSSPVLAIDPGPFKYQQSQIEYEARANFVDARAAYESGNYIDYSIRENQETAGTPINERIPAPAGPVAPKGYEWASRPIESMPGLLSYNIYPKQPQSTNANLPNYVATPQFIPDRQVALPTTAGGLFNIAAYYRAKNSRNPKGIPFLNTSNRSFNLRGYGGWGF